MDTTPQSKDDPSMIVELIEQDGLKRTPLVASYKNVAKVCRRNNVDAIISIYATKDEKWTPVIKEYTLILQFDDVLPHKTKRTRRMVQGSHLCAISNFAFSLPNNATCLIHCAAGRSRSTAAALIYMCARGLEPRIACQWLFHNYPRSNPNGWMLKLYDEKMKSGIFDACSKYKVKW